MSFFGSTGIAGMADHFVATKLQDVTFSTMDDTFGAQK